MEILPRLMIMMMIILIRRAKALVLIGTVTGPEERINSQTVLGSLLAFPHSGMQSVQVEFSATVDVIHFNLFMSLLMPHSTG